MKEIDYKNLVSEALEARKMAYAPYSHFKVGAALLTADGQIVKGCNIENSSYTPTNCAERTAFFKAISEGILEFVAIAVVGADESEKDTLSGYAYPCGVCRQVMREFCNDEFEIIVGKSIDEYKVYKLPELLPCGFGPENLNK